MIQIVSRNRKLSRYAQSAERIEGYPPGTYAESWNCGACRQPWPVQSCISQIMHGVREVWHPNKHPRILKTLCMGCATMLLKLTIASNFGISSNWLWCRDFKSLISLIARHLGCKHDWNFVISPIRIHSDMQLIQIYLKKWIFILKSIWCIVVTNLRERKIASLWGKIKMKLNLKSDTWKKILVEVFMQFPMSGKCKSLNVNNIPTVRKHGNFWKRLCMNAHKYLEIKLRGQVTLSKEPLDNQPLSSQVLKSAEQTRIFFLSELQAN